MKKYVWFVMVLVGVVQAQQTNTLDTYRQTFEKQENLYLSAYGGDLCDIMAALKKKGDLDTYLVVEAERKRFDADRTVPVPSDAGDAFRPASESYHKTMAECLKKYVAALDGLVKQAMVADRIDEAKAAKAEKDRAALLLADAESKTPKAFQSPPVSAGSRLSVAGTWREVGCTWKITQVGGSIAFTGWSELPDFGKATFDGTGTVGTNGEFTAKMRFLKAPKGWKPNVRLGTVSEDGHSIRGRVMWPGGSADFLMEKQN